MEDTIYDIVEFGTLEELKELLEQGTDINEKDDDLNYTALHCAIANEKDRMALFLIEQGIDTTLQDENGFTPLHYAAEYNKLDIAKAILEKNSRSLFIEDKYGNQPLWTVVVQTTLKTYTDKENKLIQLFLKFHADVNHKNNVGKTPFDIVSEESLLQFEQVKNVYDILIKYKK
ncbi:ankyrin repeat domain-containing protein [Halarcobacter sp.]|uniref:ankyrin repeat domain-containing protein n=1 Tax=Halarcobacter sp. TaxID=2321133 RepID=UPI0029F51604|nr:ankyrin repeat domain-containing protein [Halarcobacter sp.]